MEDSELLLRENNDNKKEQRLIHTTQMNLRNTMMNGRSQMQVRISWCWDVAQG
jgi:hypothetical protein